MANPPVVKNTLCQPWLSNIIEPVIPQNILLKERAEI